MHKRERTCKDYIKVRPRGLLLAEWGGTSSSWHWGNRGREEGTHCSPLEDVGDFVVPLEDVGDFVVPPPTNTTCAGCGGNGG